MRIKETIEKVPGGMMVVPLFLGMVLNTIDQLHLAPIQWVLNHLGARPTGEIDGQPVYEFLRIGGFTEPLFKGGALALIGLFLVCVGAQMDVRVGKRALKKGLVITATKFGVAVAVGYSLYWFTGDMFTGFLGLSLVAIIAAMENGNGGLYAALTGQYGNRSDAGALPVISLNDGPFFTLVALALVDAIPLIVFLAVLVPVVVGYVLGNLDPAMRRFLAQGESLVIPFFAFALGANMNLGVLVDHEVLAGGIFLGVMTVVLTGSACVLALWLTGEKSQLAGVAEASTAGNATMTPLAVAAAAQTAMTAGIMSPERAAQYEDIVPIASAQITIAVVITAILCPIAVIAWDRYQRSRGIDARYEPGDEILPATNADTASPGTETGFGPYHDPDAAGRPRDEGGHDDRK